MRVGIALFEGFEELDAIGPLEILAMASDRSDVLTVETFALDHTPIPITASHGLRVTPHVTDPEVRYDVVIVPGGGWQEADRGVSAEIAHGALPTYIATHADESRVVASVCTGAMVLAAAGLLKGRRATTHHTAFDDLERAGVDVSDDRVIDAGTVITAGGVTAGLDLGLWLIERELGRSRADETAARVEYTRQGEITTVRD